MCLRVGTKAVKKRATRDIPVFKILRKDSNRGPVFQLQYLPLSLMKIEGGTHLERNKSRPAYAYVGLHVYPTLEEAKRSLAFRHIGGTNDSKIVACHIPRGATYFEGVYPFVNKLKGMVASSLRMDSLSPVT